VSQAAGDNPFAASVGGSRRGPPTPPGVWRAFAVQRGIRLLVLPTLLGLVTALTRTDLDLPAWSVALVSIGAAVLWVPTSAWMLWARFLRPRVDDHALLLTTGEVLDRAAFLHLIAARAVEVGLLIAGLLGLAVLFVVSFGGWGVPVLVLCLGVAVWTLVMLVGQFYSARAAIRLAEGRVDEVEAAVRRAWPARMHRRTADVLDTVLAQALLRQARPDQALARLARVRAVPSSHADVLRAMIQLGRDVPPPRALLDEVPDSLPRALILDQLRALHAIVEGRGADAVRVLARWDEAREWLPHRHRVSLELLAAAAHQHAGQSERAHQALDRAGAATSEGLERQRWLATVHPRWWQALCSISGRAGTREGRNPTSA